ncbi:ribosomal small subunit pseudouridine synthase A [Lachnospiraceae bacterium KM106-2]|nr:ribosomal small subunit pseudouridine synthase A [Lachnospiraceae bacterium KM106-2]
MRLDKYLADMNVGTRSEVKVLIKKGRVMIDGEVVKKPEAKVDPESVIVTVDGENISYVTNEYYMLNKPAGVVSATQDNYCKTVIDLLEDAKRKDLFPVGRLDKDTEGLLLITNDGALSHRLLSPKKHVSKVYYAKVEGVVTEADVKAFAAGLEIDEEFTALPGELEILHSGEISEIKLKIYEGKFHQVKRMFEAVDKKVIYLKRLSMGALVLDETLKLGEYRALTKEELALL